MLKKILIGLGIIIGIIVLLAALGLYFYMPNENLVLDFIKMNPDKSAIKLVRNDSLLVEKNANTMMPLASTVKIIIAIEYAEQATKQLLNPEEAIPLSDLDKFYVPNTDGAAHPGWLSSVKDKIKDDKISIREVAKGMIKYSSNANTEWLCNRLGLDNINNRLDSLDITDHSEIYYIVSALFVGKEKFPGIIGKELESKLRALSLGEYIETTSKIHAKLNTDLTYKDDIGDLGMNIQRIWSDNLPASTVEEYTEIMRKMNSRSYFSKETHEYLDEVMEFLLEYPEEKALYVHEGMKGGSSSFMLTKALYATDKKGNKTEMAYFFDDLKPHENKSLQISMDPFEHKVLSSKAFRDKLIAELQQ